jgi:signal transduction histidine kinase
MKIMFSKTILRFLPKIAIGDRDYKRRSKLITLAVIITGIFALFYVGVSWIAEYPMGIKYMLICFFGDVIAFVLLKNKTNIYVVANLFALNGTVAILACTYYSGGIESPVFPWLVETPIILLLIAGKKIGYIWVSVSLGIAAVFGILQYSGYVYPKAYNRTNDTFFFLTCNIGLVLIIFSISLIFENFRIAAYNEISRQKDEIQATLSELKATQNQLIQSEKMASLGELTAGIAHEIQNPLNFVNNFSEVNIELIEEMKEQLPSGDIQNIMALANDIVENEKKINHHGKRADNIVKGMLQHSRSNIGTKEPTNLNGLTNEYLKLAYHGMRGKDKMFNVTLITDFDTNIGNILIAPQEIGRVIINLINNAFYAVNEKKNADIQLFEPTVTIKTQKMSDKVLITIQDNGVGIPQKIIDKIFQPFFTTKPTGQGTGLGLSLSYDIIKAQGGILYVTSEEGIGSSFFIELPLV